MKKLLTSLFIIMLQCESSIALADDGLIVVANTGGEELALSREQVRNLFMGISLGYNFKPVAIAPRNHSRAIFNAQVIGLTEARIQSYWSQMKFTGRMSPPREFSSEQDILFFLKNTKGAVSYLPADYKLPEGITIVYSTD